VPLENAHRFTSRMPTADGVVVESAGAWFASKLDHCDAVERSVQASVSAAVEAVTDRSLPTFTGTGGNRCCAGESCEARFSEPAHIAGLEEYFGGNASGDPTDVGEVRAGLSDKCSELGFGGLVLGEDIAQHRRSMFDQLQPQGHNGIGDVGSVKFGNRVVLAHFP
jgi:hypothetical protein